MASLFSDFLTALGVKHTAEYSDKRFAQMPFRTLFGLYALLREYGVDATAVSIPEEKRAEALSQLPTYSMLISKYFGYFFGFRR